MTEHGAQYDHIGSKYDEYAQTATLKRAESYTVLRMVGPLAGKRVLDLACGFGFYTRLLKQHGAAQVIGIDISPEMVRLGREQEQAEPLGVPTKSTTLQPSLCWAPLIWSPPFIYSTTRPAPTSCSACAAAPTTISYQGGASSPIRSTRHIPSASPTAPNTDAICAPDT